jgi:hypothetical protein
MSDLPETSKGKIARLPARLREAVNRRLHDGETAGQVLAWLNAQPETIKACDLHFGGELISPQNLSAWRLGGFQVWLNQKQEIESTKSLSKFAIELAEAAGVDMGGAVKALAAGKILARLQSMGDDTDLDALLAVTKAAKDLHSADIDTVKLKQAERALATKERDLELREQRFQRETAELFIVWQADQRAREIAESKATKEVKMDQLVELIFGRKPEPIAA